MLIFFYPNISVKTLKSFQKKSTFNGIKNLGFFSYCLNLLSKSTILCSLESLFFLSTLPLYPRTSINRAGRCRPLNPLLHFPSSTLLFTFLRITRVTVLGAPAPSMSSRTRCHSRIKF